MIAIFSHPHSVKHSEVPDLVIADAINKCEGELLLIGFDASDKVHVRVEGHLAHQRSYLLANLEPEKLLRVLRFQQLTELEKFLTDNERF